MDKTGHVWSTIILAGGLCLFIPASPDTALVAGGALAGIILSPDLDQSNTHYGWTHRHRGISHWPVIGTAERVLWFVGPALAAWLWTGREVDWAGLLLLFCGLCASDILHGVLDEISS